MLLRRLLGILMLSFAVVIPVVGQAQDKKDEKKKDEKKKDDAKKDDAKKDDTKKDDTKKDDTKKDKDKDKKEKANLAWKFKKDEVFYQKMSTKTVQTMKVMNNEVKQTQEQTFFFKWTVVDQKDGSWIIKQKIEGVVMKIQIGNQNIDYNSTNEKDAAANNPLADFFKALKDSEFTITLDPKKMEVTKIEGRTSQGFEGATIRAITERAGVNVAAVNYHFRDKAELYTLVVVDACSARAAWRDAMAEAPDSPEERLRSLIYHFLEYLLDPDRPAWKRRLMAREMANPTSCARRIGRKEYPSAAQ